jgi:hypothetical protein
MATHTSPRPHPYHLPRLRPHAGATAMAWTALAATAALLLIYLPQQLLAIADTLWHALVAWGMVMAALGVLWLGFLTTLLAH